MTSVTSAASTSDFQPALLAGLKIAIFSPVQLPMSLDKSAPHSFPAASAPSSSSSVAPAGDFAPNSAWRRPGMGLTSAPEERLLHHHSHGHGHHPRPHTPGLAEAEEEGGSSARRGVKRPRDQLSNCDCDNVYIPLSKKIHGLNIERQQEGDATAAASAAAAGNGGAGGGGNAPEQQQQQFVSFQVRKKHHYCERASNNTRTHLTPTSFQENYPYEASSPYYVSNHLLYHLHMEKMQRVEQQQRQQPQQQQHRP